MAIENGEWIMRGLDWDDPARIQSWEELIDWIDEIGFLPLFKNEVDGFSVEEIHRRTMVDEWFIDKIAVKYPGLARLFNIQRAFEARRALFEFLKKTYVIIVTPMHVLICKAYVVRGAYLYYTLGYCPHPVKIYNHGRFFEARPAVKGVIFCAEYFRRGHCAFKQRKRIFLRADVKAV